LENDLYYIYDHLQTSEIKYLEIIASTHPKKIKKSSESVNEILASKLSFTIIAYTLVV